MSQIPEPLDELKVADLLAALPADTPPALMAAMRALGDKVNELTWRSNGGIIKEGPGLRVLRSDNGTEIGLGSLSASTTCDGGDPPSFTTTFTAG